MQNYYRKKLWLHENRRGLRPLPVASSRRLLPLDDPSRGPGDQARRRAGGHELTHWINGRSTFFPFVPAPAVTVTNQNTNEAFLVFVSLCKTSHLLLV